MKSRLWIQVVVFAAIFYPLHLLPPLLSHPAYLVDAGIAARQLVGLAFHLGFTITALLTLYLGVPGPFVSLGSGRRWFFLVMILAIATTLASHPAVQFLGRLIYGGGAAISLALFYREISDSKRYERLPMIFGYAAVILETSAMLVGLLVGRVGALLAMLVAAGLTSLAILAVVPFFMGGTTCRGDATRGRVKPAINLTGSAVFMLTATLAYSGFFLMLLSLGELRGIDDGAQISGIAIFSTAIAFSAGNLLKLEQCRLLACPAMLVSFGVGISLSGSVASWWCIHNNVHYGIILGSMTVAFGNGITVSRCFQRASIASVDGFSGPLMTMTGVMIVTIGFSSIGHLLDSTAALIQCVVFATALITLVAGGRHVNRGAGI